MLFFHIFGRNWCFMQSRVRAGRSCIQIMYIHSPTFTHSHTPTNHPYTHPHGGLIPVSNLFWIFPSVKLHTSYSPLQTIAYSGARTIQYSFFTAQCYIYTILHTHDWKPHNWLSNRTNGNLSKWWTNTHRTILHINPTFAI